MQNNMRPVTRRFAQQNDIHIDPKLPYIPYYNNRQLASENSLRQRQHRHLGFNESAPWSPIQHQQNSIPSHQTAMSRNEIVRSVIHSLVDMSHQLNALEKAAEDLVIGDNLLDDEDMEELGGGNAAKDVPRQGMRNMGPRTSTPKDGMEERKNLHRGVNQNAHPQECMQAPPVYGHPTQQQFQQMVHQVFDQQIVHQPINRQIPQPCVSPPTHMQQPIAFHPQQPMIVHPLQHQFQSIPYQLPVQQPIQWAPTPTPMPVANIVQPNIDVLTYTLVMDRIKELKGNEGFDEVRRFFKKFDGITSEWPNDQRIKALGTKVYGKAERAYNSALNTEPYLYDNLRRKILYQLEETDATKLESFDQLMRGIQRKPNESVDELAERISKLVGQAYPGYPQHLAEENSIEFLLRSLGKPEIAVNLQLHRRPGMSFDEFTALTAKAEATFMSASRQNFQNKPAEFQQRRSGWNNQSQLVGNAANNVGIKCYNCGQIGHYSYDCNNKQEQSHISQQHSTNLPVTGANRFEVNNNQNNNGGRNLLKQYLMTTEEQSGTCSVIKAENIEKVFDGIKPENPLKEIKDGLGGKSVIIQVSILGQETRGVIDTGAQVSLISAEFLFKLVEMQKLDLINKEFKFGKSGISVNDVNGNKVDYYGVITLPVSRSGVPKRNVCFHITKATVGFDVLLGTNGLTKLGFRLYDQDNDNMIDFDEADEEYSSALNVLFKTTASPLSTHHVKLSVKKSITSQRKPDIGVMPSVESGGKVQHWKLLQANHEEVVSSCSDLKTAKFDRNASWNWKRKKSWKNGKKREPSDQLGTADKSEEEDGSVEIESNGRKWKKKMVQFDSEMLSWIKKRQENMSRQEIREKKGKENGHLGGDHCQVWWNAVDRDKDVFGKKGMCSSHHHPESYSRPRKPILGQMLISRPQINLSVPN